MASRTAPVTSGGRASGRVPWIDGIRGAAALFVVLHHIWLTTWPGFPADNGPWWLGGLLYGHMAVAVFIVVSGFSLALVPMRNGWKLPGGVKRFVRRRAWRIIPAYWAALVISIVVTALLLRPELESSAIAKGFAVHGLLLQDVIGSESPNGAFWSIAVEWQIYFVFPLILLLGRWTSLATAVIATAAVVLAAHAIAGLGAPLDKINQVTPQFLALFALGVWAVQLGAGGRAASLRKPLAAVAAVSFGAFVLIAATQGSEWVVGHFFAMDILFGVGVAASLALMHAGAGAPARGVLASPTALWLGLFSYSIYLIHAPIVLLLNKYAFGPLDLAPLVGFGLMLVVGLPLILALCWGFHLAFEAPFLRRRDLGALRTLPIVRHLPRFGGSTKAPAEEAGALTIVSGPRPAAAKRPSG